MSVKRLNAGVVVRCCMEDRKLSHKKIVGLRKKCHQGEEAWTFFCLRAGQYRFVAERESLTDEKRHLYCNSQSCKLPLQCTDISATKGLLLGRASASPTVTCDLAFPHYRHTSFFESTVRPFGFVPATIEPSPVQIPTFDFAFL